VNASSEALLRDLARVSQRGRQGFSLVELLVVIAITLGGRRAANLEIDGVFEPVCLDPRSILVTISAR
jgi:prepilin-type N-terminal cleavage/methylation domain-containing protein